MEKHVLHIAVFGILALTGCSSKQDANEKNFGAAIGHYLDQKGELCLRLNKWPVDVTEMDLRLQKSAPTGTAGQMEALAAVGLVSGEDTEIDQISIFDKKPTGRKFKIKRYTLTDSGRKFYKEKEVDRTGFGEARKIMQGDICYGKKTLDRIVKWEGPMKFGDYQEASVKYLYRIGGLADWTGKPEFRAAFPYVAQIIDGAGSKEQQGGVKLTSLGWEPKGLN